MKNKNIHVLPTDKPSKLLKDLVDKTYQFKKEVTFGNRIELPLNIYITSDEEIKEGDYRMNIQRAYFKKSDKEGLDYYNKRNDVFKKIILTTDDQLIKDGVQAIPDDFLEWFVKNPSCEFVEVRYTVDFNSKAVIIIPKEELKTSEEWKLTYPYLVVMDPDGWDRKNYQYSWFEEEITLAEYNRRMFMSTCIGLIPKEEPKQELSTKLHKGEVVDESYPKEFINKQETLEEYYLASIKNALYFNNDAQAIRLMEKYFHIKKEEQDKKMYSEEDMIAFVKFAKNYQSSKSVEKAFEQFKKK